MRRIRISFQGCAHSPAFFVIELTGDAIGGVARQVSPVDHPDDLCLLLIDLNVAIFALPVPQQALDAQPGLSLACTAADGPLDVLADRPALFLSEGGQDRQEQFALRAQGVDLVAPQRSRRSPAP